MHFVYAILLFSFVLFSNAPMAIADDQFDPCDAIVEVEKGEKGGLYAATDYFMEFHFFATKVCGVELPSLDASLDIYIRRNGCGPQTEAYAEIIGSARKLHAMTLQDRAAAEGPDPNISAEDAKEIYDGFVAGNAQLSCSKMEKAVRFFINQNSDQ